MSISEKDVRHIASLARLGVDDSRVESLVGELNTILEHMEVLSRVDTAGVSEDEAVSRGQMPLRADSGPGIELSRQREQFAPSMRDGFFMVPRLSTHESGEEQ